MVSPARTASATGAAGPEPVLRPARREDCRRIAELFRISSDGIADYIWSTLQDDYPGQAPLEIGRQRYAREDTAFSYQNCVVAERDGAVIALLHAFVSAPSDGVRADEDVDPVLRPYAELEAPGSLYISALAVAPGCRGRGIGTRLLEAARERADPGLPGAEPDLLRRERRRPAPLPAARLQGRRPARRGAAPHDPRHRRGAADERARPLGHPAAR